MSTCYRIDPATGERSVIRRAPKPRAVTYMVWCDISQSSSCIGSLREVAEHLAMFPGNGDPVAQSGAALRNLNRAETAEYIRIHQEYSE